MSSLLSAYIGRHVVNGILGVIAVVVGLDVFIAVLSELDRVTGNYTSLEAALHIGLTIPRRINDYLPYCIMIGTLFGMSSLAASSELTVMRAAGLSVWRIIAIVLKPVGVFVVVGIILTEFIAPKTEQIAASRKDVLRYGDAKVEHGGGVWNREGNAFIHFSAVEPGGFLYGIDIYRFDDTQQLLSIESADKAVFLERGQWQMEDYIRHDWLPQQTVLHEQTSQRWLTEINPSLLNVIMLKPKRLSLSNLWLYAQFRAQQGLENGRFVLSFWNKALQPIVTIALVVVGMAFVFGPMRQTTMGYRLFCGVAAGLIFRMIQNLLGPAALIYDFWPAWAVIVPSIACFAFTAYKLRRV